MILEIAELIDGHQIAATRLEREDAIDSLPARRWRLGLECTPPSQTPAVKEQLSPGLALSGRQCIHSVLSGHEN